MTLNPYSRLISPIPGFEVARSDHLINMLSCHSPQFLVAERHFISIQFKVVHSQHSLKLFGTLHLHFAQTFPGHFVEVSHLFLIELGPILFRKS